MIKLAGDLSSTAQLTLYVALFNPRTVRMFMKFAWRNAVRYTEEGDG